MTDKKVNDLIHCGRRISKSEILQIQETASLFPNLSLTELSDTISEHLNWYTASGRTKTDACGTLLEKLESRGVLKLPEKRNTGALRRKPFKPVTRSTLSCVPIVGELNRLGNIELEIVEDDEGKILFEDCISLYHYLGYRKPFGCYMRYFFRCREGLLGCSLFAGAARAVGKRDQWIGWNQRQRSKNLGLLINNTRFLIFPWVNVKNLASCVLGKLNRQICEDWKKCWNYSPLAMETFVDPEHFEGTCYKAANWKYLGMTTGMGLIRRGKSYQTTPKKIYVKALRKNFRKLLCGEDLHREVSS